VIVYKFDRLARNMHDHTAIRATLAQAKVQVHAVTERFDDTPAGRLGENLMAALAQFDNDKRSASTIDGMREGLSRGRWMWRAPVGYRKGDADHPASLVPDRIAAPLVRMAFESMASRRLTKVELLAELTSLGLVNTKGRAVSAQAFGKMLTNPLYMGRVVKPEWDIDVAGDFEPLISADLFEAVQAILQGRVPAQDARLRDHPDFPLRRVVRCGRCGKPLTASWSTGRSNRYGYYRCPARGCGGSNVKKERLEEQFELELALSSVRAEVFTLLGAVVEDALNERTNADRAAHRALLARQEELEAKRNRLVDMYLDDKFDPVTYEGQSARLDREQAELSVCIDAARPVEVDLTSTIAFARTLLEDLPGCWNRLDAQERPHFVSALYPTGLVYQDGSIGTTQTPWWMALSRADPAGREDLAPPTGFEPVPPP
jgi:hypothetical protein